MTQFSGTWVLLIMDLTINKSLFAYFFVLDTNSFAIIECEIVSSALFDMCGEKCHRVT